MPKGNKHVTNKVISFVMESLPKIESAENENIVLVIGNTGSGKSTLTNYLLGCKMEKKPFKGEFKAFPIDPKKEFAKIGHTSGSETFYPTVYKDSQFAFCDCPGFLDTRTLEEKTLTYINMQLVVNTAKTLRILVVIDINSIYTDRSAGLRNLIKTLALLLKNANGDLSPSLLFVFTKIEAQTKQDLLEKLDDLIVSYKQDISKLNPKKEEDRGELNEIKIILELISLMRKNENNIIMANLFDDFQSKQLIFDKLSTLNFIDNRAFNFSQYDDERVKFNHAVNSIASEALDIFDKLSTIPKEISKCEKESQAVLSNISNVETHKKALASKVKIDRAEKIKEIKNSKKIIEEHEESIDEINNNLKENKITLTQLNTQLSSLNTDEPKVYWQDEFVSKQPNNFFDHLFSIFHFWDRKTFVYEDIPYFKADPECPPDNGKFTTDPSSSSREGYYKANYTSGFYQNGSAKVTVYVVNKEIPDNETMIKKITSYIRRIEKANKKMQLEIDDLRAQIQEEKDYIESLQEEHGELKDDSQNKIASCDLKIEKLNKQLLTLELQNKEYHGVLKKTESTYNEDRLLYLFFAKICFILKSESPLVSEFLNACQTRLLLAPVNSRMSLLHITSCNGWQEETQELLQLKANANLKNSKGETPLHLAISKGYFEIAIRLVLSGANITITNNSGEDPLTLMIQLNESNFNNNMKVLFALMLYIQPRANIGKSSNFAILMTQIRDKINDLNKAFKDPIQNILADSIQSNKHNDIPDKSFHKKAFGEMYSKSEFTSLLEIVRFAVLGLHDLSKNNKLRILVDPDKIDTTEMSFNAIDNAYGVYFNGDSIYFGGKRSNAQDENRLLARGTLIHEITHFVANEVFKNNCNPYRADDLINKSRFEKICQDLFAKKDQLHERLKSVFDYPKAHWHIELIVRIPQLIAMTNKNEIVNEQCPELFAYYKEIFLPACQDHIWHLRRKNLILPFVREEARVFQILDKIPSGTTEHPVQTAMPSFARNRNTMFSNSDISMPNSFTDLRSTNTDTNPITHIPTPSSF